MNRPRLRFDGLPLWPAFSLASIGAGLLTIAFHLARVVDDAHDVEMSDD